MYGSFFGINGSNQFGCFDSDSIIKPLSQSNVFSVEESIILNPKDLARRMANFLLVGVSEQYLVHSSKQQIWLRLTISYGIATQLYHFPIHRKVELHLLM